MSVIESALFFVLGFLCAGFLTLMVAPAIWRRAELLTRRRIEATVPLTLNEITAGKDKVRAEYAMTVRRLEMRVSELSTLNAEQMIEVARSREEMKRMMAEGDERSAAIARLESESAELRSRLDEREEELRQSAIQLADANRAFEVQAAEIEKLNGLYEEATYAASARQIDLVARESEIEKLAEDVSRTKGQQREFERRLGETEAERRATAATLAAEKQRAVEFDHKIERLLATIADRDEKLDRQERELARMRGASASTALEEPENTENEPGRRERLETRLAALMRENKKLRSRLTEIGQADPPIPAGGGAEVPLREQIIDLAAQVVNMTILLEGEDSAAARAVAQAGKQPAANGRTSLADRVRALREAAAAQ